MKPVVGPGRAACALLSALACALPAWAQSNATDKSASASAAPPASTSAAAQSAKPKSAAAGSGNKATADDKSQVSYSIGVVFGEQLRGVGMNSESLATEKLAQGLRDALSGKAKPTPEDRQRIQAYVESAHEKLADANRATAKSFLAENGKKKDIQTTASGLQYQVLAAGSGDSPKQTDQVTVNYRGRLLDGTEFDSSYKRGQPATFPVNGVIPGWREALVLMKPGAKWQLFVPPSLAYDANSPPPIPPGSLLIFDVELVKVNPPVAGGLTPPAGPKVPPSPK